MKKRAMRHRRSRRRVGSDAGSPPSGAAQSAHVPSAADDTVVEILGLRAIAARYLNNLGIFGGI